MKPPIAVVLLNMGGPSSLDEVDPFLFNLFRDPDLVPLPLGFLWQKTFARIVSARRAKLVRNYYAQIGGRSPLKDITLQQAHALQERLNRSASGRFACHVAMRYTAPFTDEAIARVRAQGARTVVALSLYPHYTTATTGSSLWELRKQLSGRPPAAGAVSLIEIDRYPDHPRYLDALALQVKRGIEQFPSRERTSLQLLFSAHGLPQSFIDKGDPYIDDLQKTIAGVLSRLPDRLPWQLSFQSRASRARWLEPSTEEMLRSLAAKGCKQVLAVPISFVSDHIETLYEIDLLFGSQAQKLGIQLQRTPSLNTEPLFIEALAELVESRCGS